MFHRLGLQGVTREICLIFSDPHLIEIVQDTLLNREWAKGIHGFKLNAVPCSQEFIRLARRSASPSRNRT